MKKISVKNRVVFELSNIKDIFLHPKTIFKDLDKKEDIICTLIHSLTITLFYFIPVLFQLFYSYYFLYDHSRMYETLFQSNIFVFIFSLLVGYISFSVFFLLVSLGAALIAKFVMSQFYIKSKLSFSNTWKIVVFSMSPFLFAGFIDFILLLAQVEETPLVSIGCGVYSILLLILGLSLSKD